jgi:hypothetical protein
MDIQREQLEALHDIRRMMKESSRFLSLSGMSGIFAGVYALGGAMLAHNLIEENAQSPYTTAQVLLPLAGIASAVLAASVLTAVLFSARKAKRTNHRLFDHTSRRLFWSMAVPLLAGGILCTALIIQGNGFLLLLSPAMLVFYGLALVNASRDTYGDVKFLGYLQVALGLTGAFIPQHGLLLWALGFGGLHIVYGAIMWFRYERGNA